MKKRAKKKAQKKTEPKVFTFPDSMPDLDALPNADAFGGPKMLTGMLHFMAAMVVHDIYEKREKAKLREAQESDICRCGHARREHSPHRCTVDLIDTDACLCTKFRIQTVKS